MIGPSLRERYTKAATLAQWSRGRLWVNQGREATVHSRPLFQADLTAVSGISFAHRIGSRSGRTSAIAMIPPTYMTTPQIMKPVLKPSSGVAAASTTLPMT